MIEIEIMTTTKKLTKAMIKQLEPATLEDLKYFNSRYDKGYYMRINTRITDPRRTAIFPGINQWCILDIYNWSHKAGSSSLWCGSRTKQFISEEAALEYLKEYRRVRETCLKNHLII